MERRSHNWSSMKKCLNGIINDLNKYEQTTTDAEVTGECVVQIREALERQMSRVEFFLKDGTQDESKTNKAPITTHGPESNFGSVDVDLKKSGNNQFINDLRKTYYWKKQTAYKKRMDKFIPG